MSVQRRASSPGTETSPRPLQGPGGWSQFQLRGVIVLCNLQWAGTGTVAVLVTTEIEAQKQLSLQPLFIRGPEHETVTLNVAAVRFVVEFLDVFTDSPPVSPPLQCQAAWESLITLLQDKQTDDKTSETN